jgi:protocatechuate 4,5-dioxygenase alpha subunit
LTTFVLIPGLVCDGHVWRATEAALAEAGFETVVADVTAQDSITAMAEAVLAAFDGPLVPVGHSMGGRVAMEIARLAPERLRGLALLNTGMHALKPGEPEKREGMIALAHEVGMAGLAARWLPGMMAEGLEPDPQVVQGLTEMVCRMTPEIHERQIRALMGRPDASQGIGAYRGPMLLLTGRQDQWSPVAQHEEIRALCPQARLIIVDKAGHFAPVEQPGETAAAIVDWAVTLEAQARAPDMPEPDRIPDTPLLDRARANAGYALNKMAMGLSTPEGRKAFVDDEDAYLDRFSLTEEQRRAVKTRDWAEMVRLGGNLFYILKISAVDPTPIRAIGAAQAGMELQDFLNTRLGKVTNG